jgi:hypothetical protein
MDSFNKGFCVGAVVILGFWKLQTQKTDRALDDGGGSGEPQFQSAPGTTNIRVAQNTATTRQKAKHRAM